MFVLFFFPPFDQMYVHLKKKRKGKEPNIKIKIKQISSL